MRCDRKLDLVNVDSEHLEDAMMQKDPTKYHEAWNIVARVSGVRPPTCRVYRTSIAEYTNI
jgi:CTP synthase